MNNIKTLVDAHIHIHDCFDLAKFFNSAKLNFQHQLKRLNLSASYNFLLLTESHKVHYFNKLCNLSNQNEKIGGWSVKLSPNNNTLILIDENNFTIYLVAGRQIVTKENLEVLALGLIEDPADGQPIDDVIKYVNDNKALAIIPWGVGKWFGGRKTIVDNLIINSNGKKFYLGDNGNRPMFWGKPKIFEKAKKLGILNIPGSDPLPFPNGQLKPGTYGFIIDDDLDVNKPFDNLYEAVSNTKKQFNTFGKLESLFYFFYNQFAMQIVKRKRK